MSLPLPDWALEYIAVAQAERRALTQAECDRLNAEMAPYREMRWLEFNARIEKMVATRQPISSEDIEDHGKIPDGYQRSDRLHSDWWTYQER